MRTDATITRKQTDYLPNASTIGYGKFRAQFGDVIIFRESQREMLGRVVGKIESAPRLDSDHDCRGWLVVVALGSSMSHVMERWVNPADIIECFNPDPDKFGGRDMVKLLAFMFGADFKKQSIETLRAWANYGESDFDKFSKRTV